MKLTHLKAINFLSFKELSYDFESHPILIQGENLTEDSQESNGSGKSSLQAAVEFALLKTTVKEKESDLIFWGEEEATIELTIECLIRNQTLTIFRKIKTKGGSVLDLTINRERVNCATVNDANNFIIEWIGISKEDLQNYFILNKERYKSFFSSSNKDKVEMIARFSNAKLVNGVDKEVQYEVASFEVDLKTVESAQTAATSKIETLEEQVQYELNRDLKVEIEEEIFVLNNEINGYLSDIGFNEEEIFQKNESIMIKKKSIPVFRGRIEEIEKEIQNKVEILENTNNDLSKLNDLSIVKDYTILNTKMSEISLKQENKRTENSKLIKSGAEIESILSDISKNLSGSVKCPKCSHEFLPGNLDIDIEEEKEEQISTQKLLEQVQQSIQNIYNELKELNNQSNQLNDDKVKLSKEESRILNLKKEIKGKVTEIERDIKELTSDVDDIEFTIKDVDRFVKKLEGDIIQLNDGILITNKSIAQVKGQIEKAKLKDIDYGRVKELGEQIRKQKEELLHINLAVENKKQEIFNTNQWIVNFKRFDMFLANSSLKIIQGYCNKFLQSIKSDIQIRWEGIKILGNGQLRENITPYIIRNSETKSFWSFSGGERMRMEYSMILTLQRMINSTHHYGGLDLLMMDEVGEGMDALGLQDLMKSLSDLNKTILITTHVVNRNIGDRILLIRKENGISQIVKN